MSRVFTVTEAVRDAKASIEAMYADFWIEGEISNINCHSSGHCYFTLKDAASQIAVAIFRDDFRRVRFRPTNGLQVIVRGRFTIYPPQGKFQMVGVALEPKGKGGLQLAFEQLKEKLEKEGLFAVERKRPIPTLPRAVAIVTSLDGAALHDMLTILGRRGANLHIIIHPAKVQGEGASREVAEAIARLNRDHPQLDALLVGRGGGSIEDLWAFNEEAVARAIALSQIPIISCVGHETDFTIADFVADLRAPTPSAAAELVSRAKVEVLGHVRQLEGRLQTEMRYRLQDLEGRVARALTSRMLQRPAALIEEHMQDVDLLRDRLLQAIQNRQDHWRKDLRHLSQKLHLLSPLATVSRGYSILRNRATRKVIQSARDLQPKDQIEVQLHDGRVYAQVERTEL